VAGGDGHAGAGTVPYSLYTNTPYSPYSLYTNTPYSPYSRYTNTPYSPYSLREQKLERKLGLELSRLNEGPGQGRMDLFSATLPGAAYNLPIKPIHTFQYQVQSQPTHQIYTHHLIQFALASPPPFASQSYASSHTFRPYTTYIRWLIQLRLHSRRFVTEMPLPPLVTRTLSPP
jgi:hypothetical protein